MKKHIPKKKILITIIITIFLTLNIQVSSENSTNDSKTEESLVTIKIGTEEYGLDATYIDITFSQTQIIIEKLKNLKQKLNQNEIDDITYFNDFITIFQEENIIPKECNLDLILEIYNSLFQNITLLKDENLILKRQKQNTDAIDYEIPIHLGKRTIIASLGIGNYLVRRIIPIIPYGFIDIMNKDILGKYNLTSTFSYAAACMWTPGPSGYHVLHSFIPITGFENLTTKTFVDKSIGGFFILGLNISLEAFSKDGNQVYFDATIGIYGADLMIGF
jgi:hypothetical protein